jgi:hypothetical protein
MVKSNKHERGAKVTKALTYEATPFKVGSSHKEIKNKVGDGVLENINTSRLVWCIVKRHKFGIVSVYAIGLTAVWLFPPLPHIIVAFFNL